MTLLRILACALAVMLGTIGGLSARPVTVTDSLGRTVTLPAPAKRIVLAQGRQLNALGLIHPDPVSVLAGWGGDHKRQNPDAYALYRKHFPAIDAVPIIGDGATAAGFSLEKTIALSPDLVVLSRSVIERAEASGILAKLEAAGLPVIVIDFFLQPLKDTVPSLRALGKALGQEERSEAFIRFYEEKRAQISSRLDGAAIPSVFMHAHAGGFECCSSPGRGTLNDFIAAAGGRNVAIELLPGASGQISLEHLLKLDPAIYVATGGTHLAGTGGLVLGLGVPEDQARASFATLLATRGLGTLSAVRNRRAYGLWHLFNDTPLHIVAIEVMARWFHPGRFPDADPNKTLREISTRFSAVPLEGTLWLDSAGATTAKP